MTEFVYGDRVAYIGMNSSSLVGDFGTVNLAADRQPITHDNIPVLWDSLGKHMGVFPYNLELLSQEPDWEV